MSTDADQPHRESEHSHQGGPQQPPKPSELPPLGKDKRRPKPLDEEPDIAREYDPGFSPPAQDDDPWQDEGRPEASG
jgi:hypothetical protein